MAAITLDWDSSGEEITYTDWNQYLKSYSKSTVFQNWSYGEASAAHDGFKLIRGYVRRGAHVIGLVQAFSKRSFIIGTSVRILRGPVFGPHVPLYDKVLAFREIKKFFPLYKGHWCTIMPELEDEGLIQSILTEAGLNRIKLGYQTIWLDLTKNDDELWAGLHQRWRNQAKKALGADIAVSIDNEADWLLDRYGMHKKVQGYSGPDAELLRRIDRQDLSVSTARVAGEPIAGTLFIHHGQCATYQVGWTSDVGRKMNAHNLLLWKHILAAKETGLTALDLGGIDLETAPGVAHFKSGLGGERVTFVGTYI